LTYLLFVGIINIMNRKWLINTLVSKLGGRFASELGIDLRTAIGVFKWFLASVLFGARISEKIVINTYKEFEKMGITSPKKILDTGWDGLVRVLDTGGYARYDFKTATKLLAISESLIKNYDASLLNLYKMARDETDLENKLKALGKGIGNVTVNIFLRELRGIWEKANPEPQKLVLLGAKNLGLLSKEDGIDKLKSIWEENQIKGRDFADFEVALLRLGKNFCRKKRCNICPVVHECQTGRQKEKLNAK
jgi:endonuclease III